MCLAYICTAMADDINTLHAPRKSSQHKKKNLTWTWWAMFCWRRSFNNRDAGVLLIVAIYVSVCMCVHNVRKTSEIKHAKRKPKPKPKPNRKKLTKKKTVAEIRLGNRNAQQITTDQSWWKLLKEIEVLGPRLRFEEHLQFCKASRSCDDRTRSGSCRACVRRRSALGTQCTNVAGVRRTIE